MARTIRVTGKGALSIKPDTTVVSIKSEAKFDDYMTTLEKSSQATKILKETLEKSGLEGSDLKTTSFSIDTSYESYRDKDGNYKSSFTGYVYRHRSVIKFPIDNDQLGRALYQLAACPIEVEFSISYTVSNPEDVKNELLARAVKDSKAKAEILSSAAGVSLGEIVDIDYSYSDIYIHSKPIEKFAISSLADEAEEYFDIDIDPDDIDLDDRVTIEWYII